MSKYLLVGTYTGGLESDFPPTGSQGIYTFRIEADSGKLTPIGTFSNGDIDPAFFAVRGRMVYVENERKDCGVIRSYEIGDDGALRFVSSVRAVGSKCAHICADRYGPYVFGAVYSSGNVMVAKSDSTGNLVLTDVVQHHGRSVVPLRQDAPHAHSCCQMPGGNGLLVADLGIDKIMNYRLNRAFGKLEANLRQPSVSVRPGDGPRHMTFHPNGAFLYLLTEMGNRIYVYSFDQVDNLLTEIQQISTLPEGFDGVSHAAELILSSDARYLYASNRGHDTIAAYEVDGMTGLLKLKGFCASGGRGPRHICFGPGETVVYVSNLGSNSVCAIKRDPQSGALTEIIDHMAVPAPACVAWAEAGEHL